MKGLSEFGKFSVRDRNLRRTRPTRLSKNMLRHLVLLIHGCALVEGVAVASHLEAIIQTATRAGREAGAIIAAKVGAEVVSTKAGVRDLLTAVDAECQATIEACVAADHPSHAFLGEESVPAGAKASAEALDAVMAASSADYLWIVDPIDGTTNFVQRLPLVGVSIGVARRRPRIVGEGDGWEIVAGKRPCALLRRAHTIYRLTLHIASRCPQASSSTRSRTRSLRRLP